MLLTTALLQPKNHNQFYSGNCMALTTDLFVFSIIGAQEQHGVQYGNAYTRSQFRNASWRKGTLL